MQASTGLLCPQDDIFRSLGVTYSAVEVRPTEDYYGGIESEHDTVDYQSDSDSPDDGCGPAEEKHPESIIHQGDAVDEYVLQFDDTITKEDFNSGRDCIFDSVDHGIDDTEMTDLDVEIDVDTGFIEANTLEGVDDISVQGDVEKN